MRVEEYFSKIQSIIDSSSLVQLSNVTYDKRGTYEGFIKGELRYIDGSTLHVREYVDVEEPTDRLMYAYQYATDSGKLIFRYDNTPHHKKLGLVTHPHHKHDSTECNVGPSNAPDLAAVLEEAETMVKLASI